MAIPAGIVRQCPIVFLEIVSGISQTTPSFSARIECVPKTPEVNYVPSMYLYALLRVEQARGHHESTQEGPITNSLSKTVD